MRQIFKAFIGVLFVSLLFNSCNLIGAGSFSNAQYYTFDLTKEELIERIKKFKTEYSEYRVMIEQADGSLKEDKDHYWNNLFYITYFYLPEHGLIMRCVIKGGENNPTRIGLFAVRNLKVPLDSGSINSPDFKKKRKKNKQYKKIFEEEILTPLKEFVLE